MRLRPDLDVNAGLQNRVLADVVISNPCCQTHEQKGSSGVLKAAEHSANRKIAKYSKLADDCEAKFVPLAFEVHGGFEARTTKFIKDIRDKADDLGYDWAPEDTLN